MFFFGDWRFLVSRYSVDLLIPGTRGSHTMVVVLDEAGTVALKPPVVVQECRNHGAKLFKVCVRQYRQGARSLDNASERWHRVTGK